MADTANVNDLFTVPTLQDAPDLLRAEHITKSYGPTQVLRGVDMHVRKGEVLALVGDNGAGKSTFIKVLAGFHQPNSGQLIWEGQPLHLSSPVDARKHGIETVYQDLALIDDLTVFQNMFLGREPIKRYGGILPLTDNGSMKRQTRAYLSELGINLPSVSSLARDLSGGQRQSIAVARAMQSNPKLLIMDEPLAALGVREGALVLGLVQELRKRRQVSIIMIVHNYSQVFEVSDRINFLHSGEIVLDVDTDKTSEEELIHIVKSGLGRQAVADAVASTQV
ncbi:MAG: ATP-binding cassette domain-containing protein [Chloroflexota bacterium]|nr:ATP-binding cassette domain-containing protein [Chloroflexota bacterium]